MGLPWRGSGTSVQQPRTVHVTWDPEEHPEQRGKFPDNTIVTTRYTLLTFLPINLMEQFQRLANFYFLAIILINVVIDSPVSSEANQWALAIVIGVTSVKQAYEDWVRHRGDTAINNQSVTVLGRQGATKGLPWRRSGGEQQPRTVHVTWDPEEHPEQRSKFPDNTIVTTRYTLFTFLPVNLMEQFRRLANFYFLSIILINVVIDSPVSSEAVTYALAIVVGVTSVKQAYEDWVRHRGDTAINNQSVTVLGREGATKEVRARQIRVGEVVRVSRDQPAPTDLLLLATPNPAGTCHVTTANLDGETNLKTLRIPRCLQQRTEPWNWRLQLQCDPPTPDLYTFHGRLDILGESVSEPLGTENLLLRGATLKNTEFVCGCAIYTGRDTKLTMNMKIQRNKFSVVERRLNKFLYFCIVLLLAEILICCGVKYYFQTSDWFAVYERVIGTLPPDQQGITFGSVLTDAFSFGLLLNYYIPISLYVTMEMQKFLGSLFVGWDVELYSEEMDECAVANTSDLNEELGQIEFLFTDKTGTLTENEMLFRSCSILGTAYEEKDLFDNINTIEPTESFWLIVATCHTVEISTQLTGSPSNSEPIGNENPETLEYQGSSSDEVALLNAAKSFGVVFLGECNDVLHVRSHGRHVQYQRLDIIEFTSERRRMSVVVKDPGSGEIWLFCKGAESSVLPLCTAGPADQTLEHVNQFADRGLRTLVFARRSLSSAQWTELQSKLTAARLHIGPTREQELGEACAALERDLELIGASALEDRLQEGVAETLISVRSAGLRVWLLTGDKAKTALSVSLACGHVGVGEEIVYVTDLTEQEACLERLRELRLPEGSSSSERCLLIDGTSLATALLKEGKKTECADLLREVAASCRAVLACRLSPIQKAQLVRLMKSVPNGPITAAVGDGANDVSMLQEAHIGIGIFGREGRQAVRSSDFAVPKFRGVCRLLLVHGHWFYWRLASLILFFFYKSAVFITPQFFFALDNLASVQELYPTMFMLNYALLFTSVPPIAYGLLERNLPAKYLLAHPEEYAKLSRNSVLSWTQFCKWMLLALYHSVVLYYGSCWLLRINSASLLADSSDAGMLVLACLVFHGAVTVSNIRLLMLSRSRGAIFFAAHIVGYFGQYMTFVGVWSASYMNGATKELFKAYTHLLWSPTFWLLTAVLSAACLVPDLALDTYLTHRRAAANINSSNPGYSKVEHMDRNAEILAQGAQVAKLAA